MRTREEENYLEYAKRSITLSTMAERGLRFVSVSERSRLKRTRPAQAGAGRQCDLGKEQQRDTEELGCKLHDHI